MLEKGMIFSQLVSQSVAESDIYCSVNILVMQYLCLNAKVLHFLFFDTG